MKILRWSVAVLLTLFCLWLLLPVTAGIFHIGMIYPVILLLPLIFCLWKPALLLNRRRRWATLFLLCYCAVFLLCGATLFAMARAAQSDVPADGTVVVLGCKVNGSAPSRVLYDRCDAAADYLRDHPNSLCVATGGRGTGEEISEAEAIFNTLTAKGIAPERIYLEEASTNTEENLANAARIIDGSGLSTDVAIATDGFHQLRAGIYAKRAGLAPYAVSSSTYLLVMPGYWAREILAVWKALLP